MFFTKDFLSVVRFVFWPLSLLYGLIVWLRNRLYDVKFFSSVGFSLPVISVGNLSTGGTGKTPHVEYLIRLLQYEWRVATLSRGYKRITQGFLMAGPNTNALHIGDEPAQYHARFPDVVVAVGEERMTAIPHILQRRPDVDLVLLDDAYQHRSVKAGLSILITDFAKPYYKDYVLPLGNLRESRRAADRADVIIVSKCPPDLSPEAAADIRGKLAARAYQRVYFSTIDYTGAADFITGEPVGLRAKNILLVCAIAAPQPLVSYLEDFCEKVHVLSYPDHHYFGSRDLTEIKAAYDAWEPGETLIVTTEKDATRLRLFQEQVAAWQALVAVVSIQVRFLFSEGHLFDQQVASYVMREIAENNPERLVETDTQPEGGQDFTPPNPAPGILPDYSGIVPE